MPITQGMGEITPWIAGPSDEQHRFNEAQVIRRASAFVHWLSREQIRYPELLLIIQLSLIHVQYPANTNQLLRTGPR